MEIWKSIPDYEGYEVSNLGRVKSLKFGKERILKSHLNSSSYLTVGLFKDNKRKPFQVHQLVAIAFLNHTPSGMKLVINHINFDKQDNCVENLEIVTQRENSNRKHLNSISGYTGVYWNKKAKKWQSQIRINKKRVSLGYYINIYDAHLAYENKLKTINI